MPKPRDDEGAEQHAGQKDESAGSNPAPDQEQEHDQGLSRLPFATAAEASQRVARVRGALAKLWDKNHAASAPDPAPADSPEPEPSEADRPSSTGDVDRGGAPSQQSSRDQHFVIASRLEGEKALVEGLNKMLDRLEQNEARSKRD